MTQIQELLRLLLGMSPQYGCGTTGCAMIAMVFAVGCGFLASLLPSGWTPLHGALPPLTGGSAVDPDILAGVLAMLPFLALVIFVVMLSLAIIEGSHK